MTRSFASRFYIRLAKLLLVKLKFTIDHLHYRQGLSIKKKGLTPKNHSYPTYLHLVYFCCGLIVSVPWFQNPSMSSRIHHLTRKMEPEALARDFPVTVCLSSNQKHSILFAPLSSIFDNFENLFFEISFFDLILSGTDSSGENVVTVDLRFRALFSRFSLLISLFLWCVFTIRAFWFIRSVWDWKALFWRWLNLKIGFSRKVVEFWILFAWRRKLKPV